jgi:sigma54-dependent transcription regulator
MTTNQTPEAGSVAKLAEEAMSAATKMMRDSWATGNDAAWQPAYQALHEIVSRLAALAEQGQRDSEKLRAALQPFADGNWTKELAAKAYAAIEATKETE